MNPIIKKAIAVSVSVFLLFIGYYGSYRPLRKSIMFIGAIQSTGGVRTLGDFERVFSKPLDYRSPIGQEELVRNTANTVLSSLQNIPLEGVDQIMGFTESYYEPIVSRGRGMSFGQDLYLLGSLNEVAFLKTEKAGYLDDAEKYFRKAQELGPKRPQPLYGLFDVYRIKGDALRAITIGQQILDQWPTDAKVRGILQSVAEGTSSGPKTK